MPKYKDYKKNNPDSDLLYENLIIDLDSEVEFRFIKILSPYHRKEEELLSWLMKFICDI